MSSYLSGKIVPLTPSQQPTNIDHLVVSKNPGDKENDANDDMIVDSDVDAAAAAAPGVAYPVVPAQESLASYCSMM